MALKLVCFAVLIICWVGVALSLPSYSHVVIDNTPVNPADGSDTLEKVLIRFILFEKN
jgi:hypothetical protein